VGSEYRNIPISDTVEPDDICCMGDITCEDYFITSDEYPNGIINCEAIGKKNVHDASTLVTIHDDINYPINTCCV